MTTSPDAAGDGVSRSLVVATPQAYTYGSALLGLRSAQKPANTTPFYLRYVNRPLGRRIAALSAMWGLSPNQLTVLSGVLSLTGTAVIVIVSPSVVSCAIAFGSLFLAYALDSADGQLARLTGRQSPAGEWLDHTLDIARILTFHVAMAAVLFGSEGVDSRWLWVPLGFLVVSATRFFALTLAAQLLARDGRADDDARDANVAASLIQIPADTGILNLVVLLLPWPPIFLAAYTMLFAANALLAIASFVRKYRRLGAGSSPSRDAS